MLHIDGSYGEGGGMILRTSLACSIILNVPIRITNIRKNRLNPGLAKQHCSILKVFENLGCKINEYKVGTDIIEFIPNSHCFQNIKKINIDIETAGSITLVLQAIVPVITMLAKDTVIITIKGGTNVDFSPPIQYFTNVLSKYLERMGIKINTLVNSYSFYPSGMKKSDEPVIVTIEPNKLKGFNLSKHNKFNEFELEIVGSTNLDKEKFDIIKKKIISEYNSYDVHFDDIFYLTYNPISKKSIESISTVITCMPENKNDIILYKNLLQTFKNNDEKTYYDIVFEILKTISNFYDDCDCADELALDMYSADQLLIFCFLAKYFKNEPSSYQFKFDENDKHFDTNLEILKQFFPTIKYELTKINNFYSIQIF